MIGKKFGKLTVIELVKKDKYRNFLCQCECGNTKVIRGSSLTGGCTKSCGCQMKIDAGDRARTHGMKGKPIYNVWFSMKQRCQYEKHVAWKDYGGRGITVCDRWQSFENFFEDMGDVPFDDAQIDRVNNSEGYSLENCRWTDRKTNCRNKRNNRWIEYNGLLKTMAEWAEYLHIPYRVLKGRLNSWDIDRAFTQPVR